MLCSACSSLSGLDLSLTRPARGNTRRLANGSAAFGNVHYGANCAQFGLGMYGCGSFAGGATLINSGNHLPEGPGVPFVNYPYGKQRDNANMPSVMGGVAVGQGGGCTGW